MAAAMKLLAAVLLLLVIVVGPLLFDVGETLSRSLAWIQSLGVWGPVCLGALYIVACVLLVPGSILTLGAGFLFKTFWGTVTVLVTRTARRVLDEAVQPTLPTGDSDA